MKLGPQHSGLAVCTLIGCCDYGYEAMGILHVVAYIECSLLQDCCAGAIHCSFYLQQQHKGVSMMC